MQKKQILISLTVIIFSMATVICFFAYNSRSHITQIESLEEVDEISEGYLYFGRPSCPPCRLFQPITEQLAKDYNIPILYFNSDYFRKEAKVSDDELMVVFDKYKIERVPILTYIRDGELFEAYGAELSGNKDQRMVYEELTDMFNYLGKSKTMRISNLFFAALILLVGAFEAMISKINLRNKAMNNVLIAPTIAIIAMFCFRYIQFQEAGLNIFKQDPVTVVLSLLVVAMTVVFYEINKSFYRRNKNEETE